MPATELNYTPGLLPEGYSAVPISKAEEAAALRVCVLVKQQADPVAGRLVVLRDHLDAKVYLGAVVDQGDGTGAGRVHQWIELWVQSPEGVAGGVPAAREALTNKALDQRWDAQVRALDRIERPLVIKTGGERAGKTLGHAGVGGGPTWIDPAKGTSVHPVDQETGKRWMLCRDDALLLKAGLPAYGSSLHRYLYVPEAGDATAFVPVTKDAPTNGKTTTLKVDGLPFNPGGGLMMVRAFSPVRYENYADMLGGGPVVGVWHGASNVNLDAAPKKPTSGIWSGGGAAGAGSVQEGGLFLGQQGKFGRLIESLHLKLRAVADVLAGVRSFAQETQRPLLNLRPESLQVRLSEPAPGLPHLWTTRVTLADAGDAVALPIQTSEAVYYVPATPGSSIYRPESAGSGGSVRGKGSLRIRQLLTQKDEEVILEATLATDEKLRVGPNDLVWLRLNLASGRCDLFGRLESQSVLGSAAGGMGGEFRFRSLPQKLAEEARKNLAAAEGVPIPEVPLEVIPLLSTPCDLYSLAVLGVRTLLVNPQNTLAVALDELLSLARHVGAMGEGASLEERIEAVLGVDERWLDALGPQRLVIEPMAPGEALNVVPAALWASVLAMLIRMIPASVVGTGGGGGEGGAACRDLGDARQGGLHLVFDRATSDTETLLRKTRSLIVIDWNYNREVYAVIRKYMTGVKGGEKAAVGARG